MTDNTINNAQTIAGNGEGTILAGRYRIVRQLGAGGMGSVWLAEDTQLDNKPFAIKMLPSILVANRRAYRQLKDEALVAMKLTHPNIVTLRAFEENNGNPFLVMDYIDGQTLDDYLADYGSRVEHVDRVDGNGGGARRPAEPVGSRVPRDRDGTRPACPSGGIPESEVLRILKPIAAALDYAHGEGVVHRDVKPANVMIRKDGHPFILDFGIAREIQETMTRVTGKLSSGTLLYMSPEQLMGESPKPAQDIYSFAAMAYECLKGEPPFSHGQIEFQIMNKQPEPLVGRGVLAEPLVAGIMSGLAKKPEDRPASCSAVLEGNLSTQRREEAEVQNGRAGAPRPPHDDGGARRLAEPVGSRVPRDRMEGPRDRDDAAEEEAKLARAETKIRMLRLEQISDDDGFAKRKSELNDAFQKADIFFESGLWADAASRFAECSRQVENLGKLDSERKAREEAERKAREEAERKAREEAERKAREEAERKSMGRARCGKVQLWKGGPYWATANIGAEKPEDYGYYFWWGDTVGYKRVGDIWMASDGSVQNFSFCVANAPTFGKSLDSLKREGWITEAGVLAPEHDAAYVKWGGDWRMPTIQELKDLNSECDWTWTTMNGVNGYKVRGKGSYASASIFLPCAGYGNGTSLSIAGSRGYYWSSVPNSDYNDYSWSLYFGSAGRYANAIHRNYGWSVRPVQGFTK